ncbi:HEPN domain-containing protein [Pseudomonas nunensis]|uniref:HEPN domain-containing protein n=1 Tax=Pseudomonas nunensis TaxID=2961896 RepID=UPI0025B0C4C9|nr:HEPN domain-containing protein [Pseudomonas nunensis]MDN3221994.1 HEPN domain-containing protein [Pseudomonas nunensis]
MEMHSKTRRTADSDLATLFRTKELMPAPIALKEFELMERLYREIKTPSGGLIYLSEKANASFLRLVDTVEAYLPSRDLVLSDDIYQACKIELGRLYEQEAPLKDIATFLASVEAAIKSEIITHRFYTTLDGLSLSGVDQMRVGRLTVQSPNLAILEHCVANEAMVSSTWGRMKRGLWISVDITGSRKYAERRFFEDVKAACGLLAVSLTTVLERGGCAVRLTPSMAGRVRPSAATWFSIETSSNELCTSASMTGFQSITLDHDLVEGLQASEWFVELTRIIQEGGDGDAEHAVRRAIYWFFDAQADTSAEMQLVKFWSCIECFLSFENTGETTTKIKRGLTALLTFGGYGFVSLDTWRDLEREIDALYELRSSAVHDAKHSHVSDRDITTVSKWAAWAILEIAGLISNGYETRAQIKEQTDRLSEMLQKQRAR